MCVVLNSRMVRREGELILVRARCLVCLCKEYFKCQ